MCAIKKSHCVLFMSALASFTDRGAFCMFPENIQMHCTHFQAKRPTPPPPPHTLLSTTEILSQTHAERAGRGNKPAPLQQSLTGCWLGTAAGDAHLWLNSAQPAWRCLSQSDSRKVNTRSPTPFPLCPPQSISNPPSPLSFYQCVVP